MTKKNLVGPIFDQKDGHFHQQTHKETHREKLVICNTRVDEFM